MKKLISLLLVLVFIFSFAACKNSAEVPTGSIEDVDTSSENADTDVNVDIEIDRPEAPETPDAEEPDASSEAPVSSAEPESSKPAVSSKPSVSSEPAVSSKPAATSSKPVSSSKPAATSSKPAVKNECFGSNTSFRAGQVDIRPKHVYWEGNVLCVEAYVINGCDVPVQNIHVRYLTVSTEEKGFIASAVFESTGIPTIDPYYNRIHTFRFLPDTVIHANADLTDGVGLTYQIGFDKVN
ncbi:MAG: hypothetical protein IKL44_01770 [Clostridia bacterium]|nr:hypothetical protein [Clostridia bacterium]